MSINLINWLLAATPIISFLVMMLVFHWGGSRAGALSWLSTVIIAWLFFGADITLVGYTYVKAFFLSIDVLLIIWTAIFFYRITEQSGTILRLGDSFSQTSSNRAFQAIILGWLFPSFLQGMGGFGVPVAVSAPLLVSAGFSSVQAVIMASLGHGWAVTFGSMASSFQTLVAVTGFSGKILAPYSSSLLGFSSFFCGLLVTYVADGFKGIKSTILFTLLLSIILGIGQYILATNGLWIIAVTLSSIVALGVAFLISKFFLKKSKMKDSIVKDQNNSVFNKYRQPTLVEAIFPYGTLVTITFLINLINPLKEFLGKIKITFQFPEIVSKFGDITPSGPGRTISIFNHPGMIIFISAMLTYGFLKQRGLLNKKDLTEIVAKTIKGSINTTIAIFNMVGVAVIMTHTQMTNILAKGISQTFSQSLFPFISPFIGALGAFITGSNNNSNFLFASLQMQTADLLNISIPLILASQTAGGALGSILAPAKVIVGCSTVGLSGREGQVMGKLLLFGLIPIIIVAVSTLLISNFVL